MRIQDTSPKPTEPRKLVLKKETLRQLTSQELRLAAGGNTSPGSSISVDTIVNCPDTTF